MRAIEALIEQTKLKCDNVTKEVEQYKKDIAKLVDAFPNEKGEYLQISFGLKDRYETRNNLYFTSYKGESVFSGLGYTAGKEDKLIEKLIINGTMDSFLSHLTEKIIPQHMRGTLKITKDNYFYF